jgi:hypothetical protein
MGKKHIGYAPCEHGEVNNNTLDGVSNHYNDTEGIPNSVRV